MDESMKIGSLQISRISFADSIEKVLHLGLSRRASYVCFANVHMTIEAQKDPFFRDQVNRATMVVADGKPIAVACRWLYGKKQDRIAGMDFTERIIEASVPVNAGIFLYGSTDEVLNALKNKIKNVYPAVDIKGMLSPPFRQLSEQEQQEHIDCINKSGAQIVLVSLGCPKQEKWMATHYQKINGVLLGVGGSFAVFAGLQKRAPVWMQRYGLEWLYRLRQEPNRLLKRYLITNLSFAWLLTKSLLKKKN